MSLHTTADAGGDAEVLTDREAARRRVQARRDFGGHLVAYVVINTFLVLVWAVTGAGYFWPVWVIALHAWDVFLRRAVTEADIDAELHRNGG